MSHWKLDEIITGRVIAATAAVAAAITTHTITTNNRVGQTSLLTK